MIKNPFVYSRVVKGENFLDREDEMYYLKRAMTNANTVFLVSPRRYGKTSLLINFIEQMRNGEFLCVYIDLYRVSSLKRFLELYLTEVGRAVTQKPERALSFLKGVIFGARLKFSLLFDGSYYIGLDHFSKERDLFEILDEIFDIPQKIADKNKKRFIVIFDEFEEIRNYAPRAEKRIRGRTQHHSNIGYIFAGSGKGMVVNMGESIYGLNKIPEDIFKRYIKERFEKTGFYITENAIQRIIELTENCPYNVQFLCHRIWELRRETKRVNVKDAESGMRTILDEQTPFYLSLWNKLTTHQKHLVLAIARKGGRKVFSKEYIGEANLSSPSSVQTSLRLLLKKDIIYRHENEYRIEDVFFKQWIRYKIH